ncbi:hypothetical protein RJ55_05713 [Drechmeria coniospora]|nr:hypothetical protein RJ55_05713 [Drechmeria coniospora]
MDVFVESMLLRAEPDDPVSTSTFTDELTKGRPAKRLKRDELSGQNSPLERSDESSSDGCPPRRRGSDEGVDDDDFEQRIDGTTEVENVLPPTQTDDKAIAEYEMESLKSSQKNAVGDEGAITDRKAPLWVKGRSSIYVDAFNLALDTVLEEEAHLFDDRETEVFRRWKQLNYETQYLRLGYYADVSDPEAAVRSLQEVRQLPVSSTPDTEVDVTPGLHLDESRLPERFTFADASDDHISTLKEAAALLYLDELKAFGKEAKIQGRNKSELIKGLCRTSQQQTGLTVLGLGRQNSRDDDENGTEASKGLPSIMRREDSSREQHFLKKMLEVLGPCIRLSPSTFHLFERVHLIFYRSTEWTEKSLTTIILSRIARRNFPEYIVCRTSNIFACRTHVLEFEAAIRLEAEVDAILESNGPPSEADLQRIVEVHEKVYPRWQMHVLEENEKERTVYEAGEGAYLRRFNPAHSYTRIMLKAMYVFGRRKAHLEEYRLLSKLLDQKLFHISRRGGWYQRKALLEEHYMASLDEEAASMDVELLKKRWRRAAVSTCEAGLQDPDCHLIHHYDLQKRLVKLERKLRIPRRLQHDFGHVRLARPVEITVEGIQLKRELVPKPGALGVSTKTVWLDKLGSEGECSVEEMCLSHFRSEGWKGYHAEGGVIRTVFAYLFYDILFLYIPNVFQTAYQTCPLDLHTDAFFPARASEINHRLVEIANGSAERLVRNVWEKEHSRRTAVVGLDWDFDVEDIAELVRCFEGSALAAICRVMAQEYKHRGGGVPDLLLWRVSGRGGEVMFAEVKSANDRLSDTQRLWIHVLTGAGVKVALCNAVAKEVREVD